MNIVGLVLIPFIFIINSFFIGKFFQKMKPNMNNFFSFSIGNISFISLCSIISILFYITPTIDNFFPFALLIAQGVLLFFYLINYRQILFLFKIDWKKILIFFISSLIAFLIWYFCIFQKEQIYLNQSIVANDSIFNFFLNKMFQFFKFSTYDIQIFFIYSFSFYLLISISVAICSIFNFDKKINFYNLLSIILLNIFFSTLVFLKIDFFYLYWSLLFTFIPVVFNFFLKTTFEKETKNDLNFFNIFLFFLVFININFIFISIILYFMFILKFLAEKKYLLLGDVIQSFIYVIVLFCLIFLKTDILVSLILLFLFLILFSFNLIYKKTSSYIERQFNYEKVIFRHSNKILLFFILIIYFVVVIFAIQNRIVFSMDIFLLDVLPNSLLNIIFLIIYFSVLVWSFIVLLLNTINKNVSTNNKYLMFIVFAIFNPFFIELLKLTNISLIPDDNQLFFIFMIFFVLFLYSKIDYKKVIQNKDKLTINKLIFNTHNLSQLVLATTSISLVISLFI